MTRRSGGSFSPSLSTRPPFLRGLSGPSSPVNRSRTASDDSSKSRAVHFSNTFCYGLRWGSRFGQLGSAFQATPPTSPTILSRNLTRHISGNPHQDEAPAVQRLHSSSSTRAKELGGVHSIGTSVSEALESILRGVSDHMGSTASLSSDRYREAVELCSDGSGGAYLLREERCGVPAAVFKPRDEEPFAPANPRGMRGRFGQQGIRAGVLAGECAEREVAAFLLDSRCSYPPHFAGVPETIYLEGKHPAFSVSPAKPSHLPPMTEGSPKLEAAPQVALHSEQKQSEQCPLDFKNETSDGPRVVTLPSPPSCIGTSYWKCGSLQRFVPSRGPSGDFAPSNFSVRDVHRIALFDLRCINLDRNDSNILVAADEAIAAAHPGKDNASLRLIPIDHGLILPDRLELATIDIVWYTWPQATEPFGADELTYLRTIDEDRDARRLRRWLGIREDCLRLMRVAAKFLKIAALDYRLNLRQIAATMCRADFDAPSKLERIVKRALLSAVVAKQHAEGFVVCRIPGCLAGDLSIPSRHPASTPSTWKHRVGGCSSSMGSKRGTRKSPEQGSPTPSTTSGKSQSTTAFPPASFAILDLGLTTGPNSPHVMNFSDASFDVFRPLSKFEGLPSMSQASELCSTLGDSQVFGPSASAEICRSFPSGQHSGRGYDVSDAQSCTFDLIELESNSGVQEGGSGISPCLTPDGPDDIRDDLSDSDFDSSDSDETLSSAATLSSTRHRDLSAFPRSCHSSPTLARRALECPITGDDFPFFHLSAEETSHREGAMISSTASHKALDLVTDQLNKFGARRLQRSKSSVLEKTRSNSSLWTIFDASGEEQNIHWTPAMDTFFFHFFEAELRCHIEVAHPLFMQYPSAAVADDTDNLLYRKCSLSGTPSVPQFEPYLTSPRVLPSSPLRTPPLSIL